MAFGEKEYRAFAWSGEGDSKEVGAGFSLRGEAQDALAEFWADGANAQAWPSGIIWRWAEGEEDLDGSASAMAVSPGAAGMARRIAEAAARRLEEAAGEAAGSGGRRGL